MHLKKNGPAAIAASTASTEIVIEIMVKALS